MKSPTGQTVPKLLTTLNYRGKNQDQQASRSTSIKSGEEKPIAYFYSMEEL